MIIAVKRGRPRNEANIFAGHHSIYYIRDFECIVTTTVYTRWEEYCLAVRVEVDGGRDGSNGVDVAGDDLYLQFRARLSSMVQNTARVI